MSSLRSVDRVSADSGQAGSVLDDSPLTTSTCRYAGRHVDHPPPPAVRAAAFSTLPSYRRCKVHIDHIPISSITFFSEWPGTVEELLLYQKFLNSLIPGIKVTFTVRTHIISIREYLRVKCTQQPL